MKIQATLSGLLACLLVPALATAATMGASITINDLGDGVIPVDASGFDPISFAAQPTAEGIDLHGEYFSSTPLSPGGVVAVNFNFLEPAFEGGGLSDTLNITFTGHSPRTGDQNNISVDLHFRSDPESGTALLPLVNGISINETGAFQDLSAQVAQLGGPTDFSVAVASDVVPEPATWGLMLIGTAGIVLGKLRRRR